MYPNQRYRIPDSVNGVIATVELEFSSAASVGVCVILLVAVLLPVEAAAAAEKSSSSSSSILVSFAASKCWNFYIIIRMQ